MIRDVRIQGFAGWKAGMTHILTDMNPKSGAQDRRDPVPVTSSRSAFVCWLSEGTVVVRTENRQQVKHGSTGNGWNAFPELERR